MDPANFQSAIERIVGAADFEALADYLADDVEFKLTVAVGSPTDGEGRGKQAVIDYFRSAADTDSDQRVRSLETFGSPERFVVAGKSGVRARSEYVFVFDVSDGLIRRLLVHHDLSLVVGPHRERPALSGVHRDRASRSGSAAVRALQEA